jgi:hypothetical protein
MIEPREVEIIHARLDEQGRLITQHGDRLNIHATRMDGLMLVVFGDDEKEIKGLLHRTGELEKLTAEIQLWRRDIMIYARAGIAILSFTSIGTWLPYILDFLEMIGG